MSVPIFRAEVTAGETLVFLASDRDRRQRYLRGLVGERVEVTIRKERQKRTLDMNSYLHARPFPILADYFGDSVEGVKFDLMGEFFGWTTTKGGHRIPVKAHTSDMTREESGRFVDWLIPWALTNHGVVIPLPNEAEDY